jgi:hypothetical protein
MPNAAAGNDQHQKGHEYIDAIIAHAPLLDAPLISATAACHG